MIPSSSASGPPLAWLRQDRRVPLFALLLACAAVAWVYAFDPARQAQLFIPCAFHAVTGWDCPGCGMTRSAHHLLHGDAAAALRANPLSFLALPLASWLFAAYIGRELFGYRFPDRVRRLPAPLLVALCVAVAAFCVWRNLPAWPL